MSVRLGASKRSVSQRLHAAITTSTGIMAGRAPSDLLTVDLRMRRRTPTDIVLADGTGNGWKDVRLLHEQSAAAVVEALAAKDWTPKPPQKALNHRNRYDHNLNYSDMIHHLHRPVSGALLRMPVCENVP